jgi:hypothetical protein
MGMGISGLTQFEQAVLDKLLAGDHAVLGVLRAQAAQARLTSREQTGVGFFCELEVPADAPRVTAPGDFELGDVGATIDGLEQGAGFLLFVRDGRMTMLEGYTYDEPWPAEIRSFTLTYQSEPRDFAQLVRAGTL